MAEGLVDRLEAVDVDEQHRHRRPAATDMAQQSVQPLLEMRPVGQAGQRVLKGQVTQAPVGGVQANWTGTARDGRCVSRRAHKPGPSPTTKPPNNRASSSSRASSAPTGIASSKPSTWAGVTSGTCGAADKPSSWPTSQAIAKTPAPPRRCATGPRKPSRFGPFSSSKPSQQPSADAAKAASVGPAAMACQGGGTAMAEPTATNIDTSSGIKSSNVDALTMRCVGSARDTNSATRAHADRQRTDGENRLGMKPGRRRRLSRVPQAQLQGPQPRADRQRAADTPTQCNDPVVRTHLVQRVRQDRGGGRRASEQQADRGQRQRERGQGGQGHRLTIGASGRGEPMDCCRRARPGSRG